MPICMYLVYETTPMLSENHIFNVIPVAKNTQLAPNHNHEEWRRTTDEHVNIKQQEIATGRL